MAYEGYLVKIGDFKFPMKYIAEESYEVTPKQRQELDAYRDSAGTLHREVAPNRPSVVTFETISGLSNKEVQELFSKIHERYMNEAERKVPVTYYLPETDSYSDQEEMYIPNMKFPIDCAEGNKVVYNSIAFSFIGY